MQLSMDFTAPALPAARAAGEQGMRRAITRAERDVDGFSERARSHALAVLKAVGPTDGEALVNACKSIGITPSDDRAFGAVFAALARGNLITCVGYCLRKKGNGTAGGRVWKAVE